MRKRLSGKMEGSSGAGRTDAGEMPDADRRGGRVRVGDQFEQRERTCEHERINAQWEPWRERRALLRLA